jgi:hypothetical protein
MKRITTALAEVGVTPFLLVASLLAWAGFGIILALVGRA